MIDLGCEVKKLRRGNEILELASGRRFHQTRVHRTKGQALGACSRKCTGGRRRFSWAATVIGKFEATASVDATFDFVMDGVNLVGCVVSEDKTVNFEALITFAEPGGDELQVVDIGLVRRMHKLDFGHVEPDYSDEDPTFEKY